MPEEIKAQTIVQLPSSIVSQEEPQPQNQAAEQVIAAAIQTGAAAERTESAATEATKSAKKAEQILSEIRSAIKPELEAISQRLTDLEAEEPEEPLITLDGAEDTPTIASAEIVKLDEPPKQTEPTSTRQDVPPENKRGQGGFLRRLFLNL
jgi:hypothetical protein